MACFQLMLPACWVLCFSLVVASSADVSARFLNAPGRSNRDTFKNIRRELAAVSLEKREDQVFKNSTALEKVWDEAVLLKFEKAKQVGNRQNTSTAEVSGGIEIVCTSCYIKGIASAELEIGDFNISTILEQTAKEVGDEIRNFTDSIEEYFGDYVEGVIDNFADGIDMEDFAFPTFNYSFDVDIPAVPEVNIKFGFDELDLYMELNTLLSLGATYHLNLYTSNTPIGVNLGPNLEFGILFTVDLILDVEGEIDISSGFHLKLDDGFEINIALFSDEVSDIVFNGGQFEFLPVTLQSAGITLSAILRVGAHAGLSVVIPELPDFEIANTSLPTFGGGVEVGVFVHVAEFVTEVTHDAEDDDCKLQVVQEYSLALGAAAGATIEINEVRLGPVAATSIPIWYTTMASVCAVEGTPSRVATPTITATDDDWFFKRQELSTTTTETTIIYTGVACKEILVNCPVSLQETTQSEEVRTLSTAVPDGAEVTWPEPIRITAPATKEFGENAQSIDKASGSPSSYTPTPSSESESGSESESESDSKLDGEVGGVSTKVIVGVSVGLGVPVLAGIGVLLFFLRRKKRTSVPQERSTSYHSVGQDESVAKTGVGYDVTETQDNK